MIRILLCFFLLCTFCMEDVTGSVVSNILNGFTSLQIQGILDTNTNNDLTQTINGANDAKMGFEFRFIEMERLVKRLSEQVHFNFNDTFSNFSGVEFGLRSKLPILHVAYIKNEARLIPDMGTIVTLGNIFGGSEATLVNISEADVGDCSYKAFNIHAKSGGKGLHAIQFAVYNNSSGITGDDVMLEERVNNGNLVSIIRVAGHPKFTVAGTLVLAQDPEMPLTESKVATMMGIVGQVTCGVLQTIIIGECENGIPQGVDGCDCDNNYYGETCGIRCVNGDVIQVPPGNRSVCKCHVGYGGEDCEDESPVMDFLTRSRTAAKECQNFLTRHSEYMYKNPNDDLSGVDSLLYELVQTAIIDVNYTMPGEQEKKFEFDDYFNRSGYYEGSMERHNDLLAAIYVSDQSVSGAILIKYDIKYADPAPVAANSSASGDIGVCSYHYTTFQRFSDSSDQGGAEIFFAVGLQYISTMPTSFRLTTTKVSASERIDQWEADGTSMENIMLGTTFIGRNELGEMSAEELDKVAMCYITEACNSLPIDCGPNGQQIITPTGPMCECDGQNTGPMCNLPLC